MNCATEVVSPEALRTRCSRHGNTGCFQHNGQWREHNDVLTVTFSPIIILNNQLDDTARQEALRHEQRHFRDFRGLAQQLRTDLLRTVRQGRYTYQYMNSRWEWFLYDICRASRAFHQSLEAMVEICNEPGSPRPL
jgi:hypothetical protein